MNRPLVIAATTRELEYVDYDDKHIIGVNATNLQPIKTLYKNGGYTSLVLFGSSGMSPLSPVDHDRLYAINKAYITHIGRVGYETKVLSGLPACAAMTFDYSVRTYYDVQSAYFTDRAISLFDMESFYVAYYSIINNIPLYIIRYVIDSCYKKIRPIGINHVWRKLQHKKRQREFNEIIQDQISCK